MSGLIFNESEIYFEYANSVYALEHAFLDSCLECDMIMMESSSQNDTEKNGIVQRLIHSFKAFIKKCMDLIQTTIDKITKKVSDKVIENNLNSIIKNFPTTLKKCKDKGITSFKYYDMEALRKIIIDEAKAYEKVLRGFSNKYIYAGAKPEYAEKFLNELEKIKKKFDGLIKNASNDIKVYNIKDAEKVAQMLQKCRVKGRDGYTDVLSMYKETIKRESDHAISIIESLDKYSEETGYVQNAKTYQQMIQNTVIYMQRHVADITSNLIFYGIPLLCELDKEVRGNESETRNMISFINKTAGDVTNAMVAIKRYDEIDSMKRKDGTLSFI